MSRSDSPFAISPLRCASPQGRLSRSSSHTPTRTPVPCSPTFAPRPQSIPRCDPLEPRVGLLPNADPAVKTRTFMTSERLAELRKMVDEAIKDHRIFTIRGGWQTLRRAFLRRNWIEKCDVPSKAKQLVPTSANIEELCQNLPSKQSWETSSAHIMKCERTIMSRLLQLHDVDFYWNTRRDNHDMQFRLNCNKLMSRFSRSLFTSKEGLCLLLQQMYWHNEPGLANVNFPRCYVLGFPDHYHNFVDDFRLTACMALLKNIIHLYETQDQYAIQSPEGTVPYSAFQFAMDRLNEFIAIKKHMDIDVDIPSVGEADWTQFLTHFQLVVHDKHKFLENKSYVIVVLVTAAKAIIRKLQVYWPQLQLDGMRNIWIMKPGNKCRGRGIQLIKDVKDVARIMDMKLKYVVQKYIERPLIILNTKFDIRQWFIITSVQPLIIWMYKESYLRFSSQNFNLDNFHESLHLTNHAVQCKYKNTVDRDQALPDDNMWDCYTFQTYLRNIGHPNTWDTVIYPGMRESIIGSMLSCQETMDRRPNTFELYGADFIIAEDFKPWLLEINSSPDLSSSTSVTARMCPQCLEDLVKVVIDKRRDPACDTGFFDCIFKQNFPRPPAYLGMSLSVRGRRIFKRHKKNKDKENDSLNGVKTTKKNSRLSAPGSHAEARPAQNNQRGESYSGPIIADLMEEIQRSNHSIEEDANEGIEIFQPVPPTPHTRKRVKPVMVPASAAGAQLPHHSRPAAKRRLQDATNCSSTYIDPTASPASVGTPNHKPPTAASAAVCLPPSKAPMLAPTSAIYSKRHN